MQRGLPSGLPPPSLLLRLSQLVSHGIVSTSIHPSFSPPSSLSPSAPPPLPSSPSASRATRRSREREREREKGYPIDGSIYRSTRGSTTLFCPLLLLATISLLFTYASLVLRAALRRHRDYGKRGADSRGASSNTL